MAYGVLPEATATASGFIRAGFRRIPCRESQI